LDQRGAGKSIPCVEQMRPLRGDDSDEALNGRFAYFYVHCIGARAWKTTRPGIWWRTSSVFASTSRSRNGTSLADLGCEYHLLPSFQHMTDARILLRRARRWHLFMRKYVFRLRCPQNDLVVFTSVSPQSLIQTASSLWSYGLCCCPTSSSLSSLVPPFTDPTGSLSGIFTCRKM
jgi:hypothetical protein